VITIQHVYYVVGALFAAFSLLSAFDAANPKRFQNAIFWGLIAASLLFGTLLSDLANGVLVVAIVVLGGFFGLGVSKPVTTTTEERQAGAAKRGNWLFGPVLLVPLITMVGTIAFLKPVQTGMAGLDSGLNGMILSLHGVLSPVIAEDKATVISLALACVIALVVAWVWLRPPLLAPLQEGRRMMDSIGWAALLPQLLASLGAVFLMAKVGEVVGGAVTTAVPLDGAFAAVVAYCVGMALFTIIMGNAFAAFPVMTAAIGLPFLILKFHGDPAIISAIGMLAGFCGTLMTPMAANFNVVPANLLELPDRNSPLNGVIRAQIPTALPLLLANIGLMYVLAFPR
jgi:uncharacterized membrane protein